MQTLSSRWTIKSTVSQSESRKKDFVDNEGRRRSQYLAASSLRYLCGGPVSDWATTESSTIYIVLNIFIYIFLFLIYFYIFYIFLCIYFFIFIYIYIQCFIFIFTTGSSCRDPAPASEGSKMRRRATALLVVRLKRYSEGREQT